MRIGKIQLQQMFLIKPFQTPADWQIPLPVSAPIAIPGKARLSMTAVNADKSNFRIIEPPLFLIADLYAYTRVHLPEQTAVL